MLNSTRMSRPEPAQQWEAAHKTKRDVAEGATHSVNVMHGAAAAISRSASTKTTVIGCTSATRAPAHLGSCIHMPSGNHIIVDGLSAESCFERVQTIRRTSPP
jgi:hypothetical protein